MLPVQPTGPAISLELDVDDGEVENYEVCFMPLLLFIVARCRHLLFCCCWCFPQRPSWILLSAWERPSSADWPRGTLNNSLPIDSTQITISLSKHCEHCPFKAPSHADKSQILLFSLCYRLQFINDSFNLHVLCVSLKQKHLEVLHTWSDFVTLRWL